MKKTIIIVLVMVFIMTACDATTSETTYVDEPKVVEQTTSDTADVDESKDIEQTTENSDNQGVNSYQPSSTYKENGVWYEVFVRSFADGNQDGIGDLKGLTEKLDYLNDGNPNTDSDLGINGLWLMPINPSPSYHGYDVTDYYAINPDYGTMEDFEAFLDQAHQRGIKVIIDLVLNHTSYQHPYFQAALSDDKSPYRDYYRFEEEHDDKYNFQKQVWNHKVWNKVGNYYYYAIFWDQMPDLNYSSQALRDEMINVATFWLEKGVDGFRVDAVSHIFGAGELEKGSDYASIEDAWWMEFNQALRAVNPDYYLVGEAWEPVDTRVKYNKYFDTTFDFELAEAGILTMVKNEIDLGSENNGLVKQLKKNDDLCQEEGYPFIDGPFLANHDQRRAMDYLNGDELDMKLAANIYMTLAGNPFIYYGEEIGMLGNKPDENIREPFIWGTNDGYQTSWEALNYNSETQSLMIQERLPDSLLNHYKELIRLRQGSPALLSGSFEGVETENSRVVAYKRLHPDQKVLVLHNLSSKEQSVMLEELASVDLEHLVYEYPSPMVIEGHQLTLMPKSTYIMNLN